jgi:hypothetical protein
MSRDRVLRGTSDVKRHQILSVHAQRLVNAKTPLGNPTGVGHGRSRERGEEERQSLPPVISHGDAGGGHYGHEGVERRVGYAGHRVFEWTGTRRRYDVAIGGCVIQYSISQSRRHDESGEQSHGFVAEHPFALLFLGTLLADQDGPDGGHERGRDEPVEVRGGDGVVGFGGGGAHAVFYLVESGSFWVEYIIIYYRMVRTTDL